MQVKAILFKDLPPYGLWQWVCGGLNVMDALLVVCWLGITLTWTWAKSAGRIPRIKGGCPHSTCAMQDQQQPWTACGMEHAYVPVLRMQQIN